MSITKRTKRQRVRALWPGNRRPSSTTDGIPPSSDPSIESLPRLTRHSTDPTTTDSRLPPLYVFSSSSDNSAPVTMSNSATITFSQTGVQPPVYVVTSLSEPPWETLEMSVDNEQTASANLIFTRHFDNAPEGDHQYKVRIGDGHWVVDESKDSGTPCPLQRSLNVLIPHSCRRARQPQQRHPRQSCQPCRITKACVQHGDGE